MQRPSAPFADARAGKSRPHTLLWVRIVLGLAALAVIAWTVNSLRQPTLTPEQIANVDAEARYAAWQRSPGAATFERLRAAGLTVHPDTKAIGDVLVLLNKDDAQKQDVTKAVADARRLLQKHQGALVIVRNNLREPYSSPPLRSMDDLMPYFADFRTLARLLMLQAELARREGRPGEAAECGAVGMQFGAQIMRGEGLIGRLVGIAIQALSRRPLWKVLPDLSAIQARALVASLREAARTAPPAAETFAAEKWLGQRTLLQLFGDRRVTGKAPKDIDKGAIPISLFWSRRKIFADYTRAMETWETRADTPYNRIKDAPPTPPDIFNRILLPVYEEGRFKELTARTQNNLLLTQVALRAYQAEQKKSPGSLNALVPRYLPVLPGDPFNENKPFHLQAGHNTATALLYSLGPDGKDDGGSPILNTSKPDGSSLSEREKRFVFPSSRGDVVVGVNSY